MRAGFAILPLAILMLSGCLDTGNAISFPKAREIARQCVNATSAPGGYRISASTSGYGEVSLSSLKATPLKKFGATDEGAAEVNACIRQRVSAETGNAGVITDAQSYDASATREDYVPELSAGLATAPVVEQNHCSAVLVGGSGYCIN